MIEKVKSVLGFVSVVEEKDDYWSEYLNGFVSLGKWSHERLGYVNVSSYIYGIIISNNNIKIKVMDNFIKFVEKYIMTPGMVLITMYFTYHLLMAIVDSMGLLKPIGMMHH